MEIPCCWRNVFHLSLLAGVNLWCYWGPNLLFLGCCVIKNFQVVQIVFWSGLQVWKINHLKGVLSLTILHKPVTLSVIGYMSLCRISLGVDMHSIKLFGKNEGWSILVQIAIAMQNAQTWKVRASSCEMLLLSWGAADAIVKSTHWLSLYVTLGKIFKLSGFSCPINKIRLKTSFLTWLLWRLKEALSGSIVFGT